MSMLKLESRPTSVRFAKMALGAAGALVVVVGFAVSNQSPSDAKSLIADGDKVMAILPDGSGYSWQGPFTISERKSYNDLVLRADDTDEEIRVSLSDVEPVSTWIARQRTKEERY